MTVISTSFEEYRPKNVEMLCDEDLHDRAVVVSSTLRYWQRAHNDETFYHEQFRGYCPHCAEEDERDEQEVADYISGRTDTIRTTPFVFPSEEN